MNAPRKPPRQLTVRDIIDAHALSRSAAYEHMRRAVGRAEGDRKSVV